MDALHVLSHNARVLEYLGNAITANYVFILPSFSRNALHLLRISFLVFIFAAMLSGTSVPLLRNSSKANMTLHSVQC